MLNFYRKNEGNITLTAISVALVTAYIYHGDIIIRDIMSLIS